MQFLGSAKTEPGLLFASLRAITKQEFEFCRIGQESMLRYATSRPTEKDDASLRSDRSRDW